MFEIPPTSQQIIDEHRRLCPRVYERIDMAMAPARYRSAPGKRSSLWASMTDEGREMIADPHLQELFRQWAMAGDPLADAFTARFGEIGHAAAHKMLDMALEFGVSEVENPPPELVALMDVVERVPDWVDWDAIERTSTTVGPVIYALGQAGWRAAFVLTFGNSFQGLPMVLTGALHKPETTSRRIKETVSVINYLTIPDGMKRGGEVYKAAVKVRVMHSLVRVNLLRNAKAWDVATYGVPIPQADMYGTVGIVSSGLHQLQKLSGKPIDVTALRYLMYLMGVDPRMPNRTVEDMCRVRLMVASTLNHRYEPWASELTEAALSARMSPGDRWLDRLADKADRQLGELAIASVMGRKNAAVLGVKPDWRNLFGATYMLVPVLARFAALKIFERMPGGRAKVRRLCVAYAYRNMGIEPKYDTRPDTYRKGVSEAA